MDVSIIVVSYNTRGLLASCLQSITAATDEGLSYETIVVDNASVDGSADMVAVDFPTTRLIRNASNRGFAAANNRALENARGRYALLLNSDALLKPGALRNMVEYMDAQPRVGVLGGRLLNPDGSFQSSFFDFPNWKSEFLLLTGVARYVFGPTYPSYSDARSRKSRIVDWVSGALFMVRQSAVQQVGGLDEDFFMYAEEMDWCYRMRKAGWDVAYLPSAEAVHVTGASAHRQPELRRAQVYSSKCLFARKHWGRWRATTLAATVRAVSAAKLGVWWIRSRTARGSLRVAAASNVASYRFLLANLPGGF